MRKTIFLTFPALAALALAACGTPADPCVGAQDPVTCKAAASAGNNDALLAGVAGYALGSMGNSGRSTHTTVVKERTVYKSPPSYRRSSYSSSYRSSGYRSSSFRSGGFRRR